MQQTGFCVTYTFKVITNYLGEQRLALLAVNTAQNVEPSLWLVWVRMSQSGLFQLQMMDAQLTIAGAHTRVRPRWDSRFRDYISKNLESPVFLSFLFLLAILLLLLGRVGFQADLGVVCSRWTIWKDWEGFLHPPLQYIPVPACFPAAEPSEAGHWVGHQPRNM